MSLLGLVIYVYSAKPAWQIMETQCIILYLSMNNNYVLYIENTRWVSFDIKFTRQGFENACWHREACRAMQHAFSKPSRVNLISKDANLVFYLSVYPLLNALLTSDYAVFFYVCVNSASLATSFKKVQRHHDLIKVTCPEIGNVYQVMLKQCS